MRAKTILTVLFLISLAVAAIIVVKAMPDLTGAATQEAARDEILVAVGPLPAGTLLRPQDIVWERAKTDTQPGEVVRPDAAAREVKPELDEEARAAAYGAALRKPLAEGEPIRRSDIVKPGARDFLDLVLAPGMRAIWYPITLIGSLGPNSRLIGPFPGDRVDIILTQRFEQSLALPITRHSVGEAVVQNVRVLAMPLPDPKTVGNNTETKTALMLEVTPEQAEKITVASELGKLAFTLRGTNERDGLVASSTPGSGSAAGIKAVWAGDVSPALGGAMPEKVVIVDAPPVSVIRGSRPVELANPPWHSQEGAEHEAGAGSGKTASSSSGNNRN
jgi:pilus assembly protein CpaB